MGEPAHVQVPNNDDSKNHARKRFTSLRIILLTLICFTILPPINAVQIDLSGQVSAVQDGYTFILDTGQTIRLADIEIPGVNQRGYEQAKATLSSLVNGKTVYLTQSSLLGVVDGRLICVAYIDYDSQNYLNVNKKMIDSGYVTMLDTRNDFLPNTWTLFVSKGTTPPPATYTLIIQTPNGSGSTDPTTGTYVYSQVMNVPAQATPSAGWMFDHWILDGSNVGAQNPYIVYMNADHQLMAVFTQIQNPPQPTTYQLIIQNSEGAGSTDPDSSSYDYPEATSVVIEAIPQPGWKLDHWTLDGFDVGDTNPIDVDMNKDRTIKAVFAQISSTTYTLTIENPIGSGSTYPPQGSYTYKQPVGVAVSATSASGWVFDHWILDGLNVGNMNPIDIDVNKDRVIKAVFTQSQTTPPPQTVYTLTVQRPEGSGSTDPPTGSYTYQQPVRVTVRAKPASGWSLDHWVLDDVDAGKSNPTEVVMNANHSLKAVFVANGTSSSGGVPGYPLESAIIGILLYLALIDFKHRRS